MRSASGAPSLTQSGATTGGPVAGFVRLGGRCAVRGAYRVRRPGRSASAIRKGKQIRKPDEIGHRKRFAPCTRIDAHGTLERAVVAQRGDRIAQRLAPLAKCRIDDPREERGSARARLAPRPSGHEARDRGFNLGRRAERSCGHDEQPLDREGGLQHHGQPSVVRGTGSAVIRATTSFCSITWRSVSVVSYRAR